MAKGTYAGLQQIKPVQSKQGDIVSEWIDKYIAEGKAEKAAKLKEMQEKNAKMEDFFRTIKIEPKDVEMKIAEANQKLTTDVTNRIGELKLKAMNAKTDFERSKYMNEANKLSVNYRNYQTTLSSKQFIDGVKEAREYYESGKAFDQSEQARSFNAYANGIYNVRLTDDNDIETLVQTGDRLNDPPTVYSTSQVMELGTRKAEPNMLNPLYDDMAKKAKLYTETWERNPTGDLKTSAKEFVREKAELDFLSRYGNFDVRGQNNNIEYKQFAKTMTGKTIGVDEWTEEDHNNLKNLWVDKVSTYAPTAKKEINEVSAYQIAKDAQARADRLNQQAIDNALRAAAIANRPAPEPNITYVGNASVLRANSKGVGNYDNGLLIKTKKEGSIVGYNVKGAKGNYVQYFIVGKDERGRMAIEQPANKADVYARIQQSGGDPKSVEAEIRQQPPLKFSNIVKGAKVGKIKYDGSYKPESEEGTGQSTTTPFGGIKVYK